VDAGDLVVTVVVGRAGHRVEGRGGVAPLGQPADEVWVAEGVSTLFAMPARALAAGTPVTPNPSWAAADVLASPVTVPVTSVPTRAALARGGIVTMSLSWCRGEAGREERPARTAAPSAAKLARGHRAGEPGTAAGELSGPARHRKFTRTCPALPHGSVRRTHPSGFLVA
jgi:hypothetical protein